MVDLNQKTIDAINLINEAIKKTDFFLNHFEVGTNGIGNTMIELDIREKGEENDI